MATLIDLLRQLGEQQGPSGENAFRGPLHVSADPVAPVTVPLPQALRSAWSNTTGRRTAAHHSLALAASRMPAPLVLQGAAAAPNDDLLLLVLAHLAHQPASTALWLASDPAAATRAAAFMEEIAPPARLSWASTADGGTARMPVQLVIAPFDDLHRRLLRFSDRTWRWLWPRLDLIAVPGADRALRERGSHIAWLFRRSERLAKQMLRFTAAVSGAIEPGTVFRDVFGPATRIVPVPSGLAEPALVGVWRVTERNETLLRLASELQQRRISVTVLGHNESETARLRALEAQVPPIRVNQPPTAARVALVAGLPIDAVSRAEWVRRGYRMLLFVVEDNPHELLFAAEVERLLSRVPVLINPRNPYVVGRHLQCAASELPLSSSEVEQWGVADQIERMIDRGTLRHAGSGQWWPGESTGECDGDLAAMVLGEPPVDVFDEHAQRVFRIRPAVADRIGIPGATWWPGSVVANRSSSPPRVDLAQEEQVRVALPLLSVRLDAIETQATREVIGNRHAVRVTRSKVRIHQRVLGLREHRPGREAATLRLRETREHTWMARGCAIALPGTPADPATAGWSLAATLPPQLNVGPDALLVAYDTPTRAIWLLETEPGGTGIAEYCFEHAEQLLTSALAFVGEAGASPCLARLAAAERSWLAGLLSSSDASTTVERQANVEDARPPVEQPPVGAVGLRPIEAVEPVSELVESRTRPPGPPRDGRRTRVYSILPIGRPAPPSPPVASALLQVGPEDQPVTETASPLVSSPHAGAHLPSGDVEQLRILPPHEPAEQEHVASHDEAQRVATARTELEQDETQDLLVDVAWEARSTVELSDEVVWAAGSDPPSVEEISWEPEPNPAPEATPPTPTQAQEIPPLGRESPVPLNSRRPPSRYHTERGEPLQRRSPSQPPPRRPLPARPRSHGDPQRKAPDAPVSPPGSAPRRSPVEPERRPEAPDEQRGDVGAMIARMRRLREDREREKGGTPPRSDEQSPTAELSEARFQPGQHVRCVPYGNGIVRKARIAAGREQLTIEFADGETAVVDPAINAVRLIENEPGTRSEEDL